jgi:hypothetical protein
MNIKRFETRREFGNDWKIVDMKTNADVSTGLSESEAEETANEWNETECGKEEKFSI